MGRKLKRVYVWERAVRVFHWLNVLMIVILIITGYIIGNPPVINFGRDATFSFWFGTVRFIHFAAAYIFIFNWLFRFYWAFFGGNIWANWRQFFPTSRRFVRELFEVIKLDILMVKGKPHISIGHNPLAGWSYFIVFLVCLMETITGLGLYADMSTWWFPQLFAWLPGFFGDEFVLRQIHHILMWVLIVFIMIHIHLVIYHDLVEGRGEISSMGGGWKFIEEEVLEEEKEKANL
jgi:Ni/Fe-hydrogenase 1 B-type cytochrome subunit